MDMDDFYDNLTVDEEDYLIGLVITRGRHALVDHIDSLPIFSADLEYLADSFSFAGWRLERE